MKMKKPTVEAVRFTSADVIATSGQLGVKLSGFGVFNEPQNNTITVGSMKYTPANSVDDVIAALVSVGQTSGLNAATTKFYAGGSNQQSLRDLWQSDLPSWDVFNGTYKWYNNQWERSGD